MTSSTPGCVFVLEHSDSPEIKIDLFKVPWNPLQEELPAVVPPKGLSAKRQWYLHEQIRPFCPENDKDSLSTSHCPQTRKQTRNATSRELNGWNTTIHQMLDGFVASARKVMTGDHVPIKPKHSQLPPFIFIPL